MTPFSWNNPYAWPRRPVLAENAVATSQPLAAQAGLQMLATGGTAAAAAALVQKLGAEILEIAFLIELSFLRGRDKLKQYPVRSLVVY